MNIQPHNRFAYVLAALGLVALFGFVLNKGSSQVASTLTQTQLAAVDASDPGMTGWWKLADGAGASGAADSSGRGQTGTFAGFPGDGSQWVAGQTGTALSFNGSNHITLPSGAAQIGSGDFSVSIWANYAGPASGNTYLAVASSRASGQSGAWAGWAITYINATTVAFTVDTGDHTGTGSIYTTVSPGWHNIVGTFTNGSSVNLYIDGVLAKTQTTGIPAGNLTSPYAVRIGGFASGSDDPFIGKLQDLRTYSRALSGSDVGQLYSAGPSSLALGSGTGTQTGTTQTTTQTSTPSNGSCGAAAKTYTATEAFPQGAYCSSGTASPGTPSNPAQGGSTSWTCGGTNGGTTASCSAPRQAATTQTTQTNTLPAPTGVTATAISTNQITITWAPVSGASSYTVYRNTSSIGTTPYTSMQSTSLAAGTTYGYTVAANDSNGVASSNQSAAVTAKTLTAGTASTGYVLSFYTYQHAGQGNVVGTVNGTQVINCGVSGSVCSALLQQNDPIVLTASPSSGSSLARWEDCPNASGNTCTITMPNWNMSMGAFFTSGGFTPKTTLSGIINQAAAQGSLTWVFTGDSFTTLNTYSAYIESYFQLHYPNINFHFRNAARSGSALGDLMDDPTINAHVDPTTGGAVGVGLDSRFDMEVYGWYPDVVSVAFSDNGHPTPQKLAADYTTFINNYILPNHSTPVLLGFWPLNNASGLSEGTYMETLSDAIDQVGRQFNAPTGMIWHEMQAFMLPNLSSNTINLDGLTDNTDTEHLNEAATLAAASVALSKLGADGDVSSATIDASAGSLVTASHATVSGVTKNASSGVDFVRKDDRLPMAFDDISRPIFQLSQAKQDVLDMNKYMLTVTNLSVGTYDVYVDGVKSATVDSNTLASGWNMTTMSQGPIHDQLVEVLGKIRDKEGVTRTRLFGPAQLYDPSNPCSSKSLSWWGDTGYNSNSGVYFLPGYRGDYLVSQLSAAKNMTACFDNLIHAAAQPVARTFSLRKVSNTTSSDTSAPSVSISSPANNASVSGSAIAINATAFDDVGVAGVQFKVDGAAVGTEDTTSPYSVSWTPTTGTHTLLAVARDAAGNRATSSPITIVVTAVTTNPSTAFKIGDRVNPTQNLTNVRSTAAGTSVNTQDIISVGTIVGGPTVASLLGTSYTWWNVDFDSGADGWVAESFLVKNTTSPGTPDTTAPSITVTATSTGATSATIRWNTDENSSSQVEYGLTTAYGSYSALDTSPATLHSVTLTGLTQNTTYHFRVGSHDASGNAASSTPDMTFTTTIPAAPGALGIGSRVQATQDGVNAYAGSKLILPTSQSLVSAGVFNSGSLGIIQQGPYVFNGVNYWYVNFDNSKIPNYDGWVDASLLAPYVSTSTAAPFGSDRTVNMYSGIAQAFSVDADDAAGDMVKINFPDSTSHGARLILTSSLPVTQHNTSKEFNFIYVPVQGFTGSDSFQYTLTDGVNTSAPYTVTFNVQAVTSSTWIPPIGIPRPEFGIDDTYHMYDSAANRNPALTYNQSASGGYYTHYIDNTNPSCVPFGTKSGNGTAAAPLCNLPNVLPAGSVVEIHGGPYTANQPTINSYTGTITQPVFIRGVGMPRFANTIPSNNWLLSNNQNGGGQYVVIEGMSFFSFSVGRRYSHVAFRNNDVYGDQNGGGTGIQDSDTNYPILSNIVFYHNHVHDVGIWDPKITGALCAAGTVPPVGPDKTYCDRDIADTVFAWASLGENIWILDSDLSHSEGDSVQVNAGGQGFTLNPNLHHVYIGRNEMYENKQTATAIKAATHVVFSQNDMWGIATSSSSLGTATGFSDEGPTDTWWIFNRIHDSELGTKMNAGRGPGPYYYIGNLIYDIHDNYPNTQFTGNYSQVGQAIADWHDAPTYFINNTIYDADFGFGIWTAGWTGTTPFVISNNIISKTDKVGQMIYNQANLYLTVTKNLFQGSASDNTTLIYWRGKTATTIPAFETLAGSTWASGNTSGNPMFTDPANGDFSLKQGSPAIDAGDSTLMEQAASQFYTTFGSDIRKDFNGNNRPANGKYDLGAIEYGATGGNQPPPTVIVTQPSNPPSNPGPTDSDGDGIVDTSDLCASTPAGHAVNSVGCPLPVATNFTVSPLLASANLTSVSNLSISNSFGKISWNAPVSLVHNGDRIDLNSNVSITKGTITVNSPTVPELNEPATVTFYNVVLSSLSALKILRDGAICPSCTGASYSNGTLTFTVPGFSTYSIFDDSTPPDDVPPTVSITAPTTGANVSGTVNLTVSATDDTGVVGVQYKLDGSNLNGEALSTPFSSTFVTSSVANGSHTLLAVARDAAGNMATSAPITVTVNNVAGSAPQITSSVTVSNLTTTGAEIDWTTDTAATTQVQYGPTTSYGTQTTFSTSRSTTHAQTLTNLAANTPYHYVVISANSFGTTTSSDQTFTTPAATVTNTGGSGGSPAVPTTGGGGGGGGGAFIPTVASTISNVNITGTLSTGISVTWTTNTPATSQVVYGLSSSYGLTTTYDAILVVSHLQKLTGLVANTLYHVQVRSKDAYGTLTTSSDLTFFISTAGSVSLATPASGVASTLPQNTTPIFVGSINTWLLLGTTNPQVKILQQILNANGFLVASSGAGSRGNESTYFGPATQSALERFQCAKLSVCSGAAYTTGYGATGPMTRSALNTLGGGTLSLQTPIVTSVPIVPVPSPSVSGSITTWLLLGTTNPQVKILQQILNASGFTVAFSGTGSVGYESTYFGLATDAALKKFQCAKLQVCSGAPYSTGYGATGPKTRAALNSR